MDEVSIVVALVGTVGGGVDTIEGFLVSELGSEVVNVVVGGFSTGENVCGKEVHDFHDGLSEGEDGDHVEGMSDGTMLTDGIAVLGWIVGKYEIVGTDDGFKVG